MTPNLTKTQDAIGTILAILALPLILPLVPLTVYCLDRRDKLPERLNEKYPKKFHCWDAGHICVGQLKDGKRHGSFKTPDLDKDNYYLYGKEVTEEEYREHELIEEIAGI